MVHLETWFGVINHFYNLIQCKQSLNHNLTCSWTIVVYQLANLQIYITSLVNKITGFVFPNVMGLPPKIQWIFIGKYYFIRDKQTIILLLSDRFPFINRPGIFTTIIDSVFLSLCLDAEIFAKEIKFCQMK